MVGDRRAGRERRARLLVLLLRRGELLTPGPPPTERLWVATLSGTEPHHATPALIGGKAWNLRALLGQGLPVPPAFVVTTAALHAQTQDDPDLLTSLDAAARALASGDGERAVLAGLVAAERLRASRPSEALRRAVAEAHRGLLVEASAEGPTRVLLAVRSSAASEDGGTHSHAGQFESVLNLAGLPALWRGIAEVWASWFTPRAIRYRLHAGREGAEAGTLPSAVPPMAVLVQRMIVPRASGVLFTVNPVSGSRRELRLEAGPGLGEALADGRVRPDYFALRREPLRIVGRGLAPSAGRLDPLPLGAGTLTLRAPEATGRRKRACVSDREVLKIAQIGLGIERRLGAPVDLEWTIDGRGALFVVQARPVTALPRSPAESVSDLRARPVLWTQRFCGERWTDQATPLGWSVIQPILHDFTFWEDAHARWLDGTLPSRLYRGRPYFNISIFRHLAFRLPGGAPPQLILEMFPAEEAEVLRTAAPYLPNLGLVASIFGQVVREKRWERYRFNFLANHRQWEEFQPVLERRIEALDLNFTDLAGGLRVIDAARALIVEYLQLHLLSLLFAHLTFELLAVTLRSWVGESGEAVRSALVATDDNATLRVNGELWDLAQLARPHPALVAALTTFTQKDWGAQPRQRLRDLPGGPALDEALGVFLSRHGRRSDASWEIFSDRWIDAPETVLRLIGGTLRGGDRVDPETHRRARRRDREHAEELVRARLRRTRLRRLVPWRARLVDELLTLSRRYMSLRENQRYAFDGLLLRTKRVFERIGDLLVTDGALAHRDSIAFLELPELRALAAGRVAGGLLRLLAEERQAEHLEDRARPHPDFLLAGDEALVPPVAPQEVEASSTLQGLGISPGRVRGTVRVLTSLADIGKLQPGDILVARATDPGWTPLFLTAAGLVLELGSMLSHGAVIAREYRLPAVVNVPDVTRFLKDGMDVTIDGDRGRVTVHRATGCP